MSQIIADELARIVEVKNKEIDQTKSVLAIQLQQLAVSKREVATVTKQLAEYSQALAAAQTDQQKAIFNQAIVALTPTLVALNNKTSGLQAAVNSTRSTLNTQQTAVANIQKQITTEEKSASQTGPVPTDPANATGNAAVNTTATEIPDLISPVDPQEFIGSPIRIPTTSPEPISPTDPTLGELGKNIDLIPNLGPGPINPSVLTDDEGNMLQTFDDGTSLLVIIGSPKPPPINPNVLVDDEGNTLQTFDDGTVLLTDSTGKVPKPSTQGLVQQTRPDATRAVQVNESTQVDWRVRLHLAPNANYLYNVATKGDILYPLKTTEGVIFPYTPAISVGYTAAYPNQELTHSNYKIFQYKGSSVDSVTITCDFTAQDTSEANYLLAVIHFFRSVTKMFYGQDQNPRPGTPPPLCYLSGLGQFQFNNHALVVTQFTYELPTEVDYIRANSPTTIAGTPLNDFTLMTAMLDPSKNRTATNGVPIGGRPFKPMFRQDSTYLSNSSVTYVPTKMKMSITCNPVVSRNQVSTDFSLKDYATGKLIQRGFW
jgi:hypothetical protein